MFTNYETRTFSYPSSTDAPLDVTCVGWTQGGCDVVWSDVLPRMLAVHGSAECGGKAVVELGAGSGLVGLLAARWASKVDITDGDEEEVSLIARNVEEHAPAGGCALSARFLEWGAEPAAEFLRDAQQPDGYDLVLAAQVVYVPAAIGPLAQSIAALMKADGTTLLYNDAVSTTATQPQCRALLDDALKAAGLRAAPCELRMPEGCELPHADAYLLRVTHAAKGGEEQPAIR